jgi:hypothetical protein
MRSSSAAKKSFGKVAPNTLDISRASNSPRLNLLEDGVKYGGGNGSQKLKGRRKKHVEFALPIFHRWKSRKQGSLNGKRSRLKAQRETCVPRDPHDSPSLLDYAV